MVCLVCGNPDTIEAHIVPRALYRMLAGDQQHAYEGSRFREGVKHQAKGLFDRSILCREHEAMLGKADAYGIRFLREFASEGASELNGKKWVIPNPQPDLLVRFVAACIWRRGVSSVAREGADLDLGLAEPKLRRLLFGGCGNYDPPLFLQRRQLVSQGQVLEGVMWLPGKAWGFGENTWSFFAFGCEFFMKLNPYSHPAFHPHFVANRRDPANCIDRGWGEISKVEGMVEIGANMLRSGRHTRRHRQGIEGGSDG